MDKVTQIAKRFAELGHEKRLLIICKLIKAYPQGLKTGEIGKCLSIADSTLTHHLSRLENCGLIERRAKGQCIECIACEPQLRQLSEFILGHCCKNKC